MIENEAFDEHGSVDQNLFEGEMTELTLFLPGWQAAELEEAAHGLGITTGQLVRRLIQDYFARFARPCCSRRL